MLIWFIKVALISILSILLVHHLLHFFTVTLTVPKIKDLVHSPTEKYRDIYNLLQKNGGESTQQSVAVPSQDYTLIDLLPKKDSLTMEPMSSSTASLPATVHNPMKDELKNFLKSQLHK